MAKTIRRLWIVAAILFVYFATQALVAFDYLPSTTPIDDVLGTLFMLALVYVAYGFLNDWKKFEK
jgi:methionine-rich copper-binding protein CopC